MWRMNASTAEEGLALPGFRAPRRTVHSTRQGWVLSLAQRLHGCHQLLPFKRGLSRHKRRSCRSEPLQSCSLALIWRGPGLGGAGGSGDDQTLCGPGMCLASGQGPGSSAPATPASDSQAAPQMDASLKMTLVSADGSSCTPGLPIRLPSKRLRL